MSNTTDAISSEQPALDTTNSNSQEKESDGSSSPPKEIKSNPSHNVNDQADHILIHVEDQNNRRMSFKIKRTTSLKKIMLMYCEKYNLKNDYARFLYDGCRIGEKDTANSLGIQNDEIIDVIIEQTGGCDFMDIDAE